MAVLLLSAGLTGASAALWLAWIRPLGTLAAPIRLPVWAVAVLTVAAECTVIRFAAFRRDARGFSLGELALVTGLYFASPANLIIGRAIGLAAVDAVQQRGHSFVKPLFNLTKLLLESCVAVVVFRWLVALGEPLGTAGWLAAMVTTIATDLLSKVLVDLAIRISGAPRPEQAWHHDLSLGFVVALTTTSIALIAVTLLWVFPLAGWLLPLPAAVLSAAFWAYARERPRQGNLAFLYETARTLQGGRKVDDLLGQLLDQARHAFQADIAEAVVLPRGPDGRATRIRIGPGEARRTSSEPEPERELNGWIRAAGDRGATLLTQPVQDPVLQPYLAAEGMRGAMAALLHGEQGVTGIVIVANRLGSAVFHEQELQVLETMASHLGAALENARLLEHLHRQALHDALTGLPNRSMLRDHLADALARARPTGTGVALLFLDLDGFKAVNDKLGHGAGDQLLVAVTRRLRSRLKASDFLARFAGDEFAVVCEGVEDQRAPVLVAERVHGAFAEPFRLDEGEARIGVSIGIALAGHGEEPESLLRSADLAMYEAKKAGKGGWRVAEPRPGRVDHGPSPARSATGGARAG